MRRLAWLSAVLLLVAAPVLAQPGWTRQVLEDGAVSVNLPIAPTRKTSGATTIYMAAASTDVVAMVMVMPAPEGADAKAGFDAVIEGIGPTDLISRKDLTVQGSPAMLVVARSDDLVLHNLFVHRGERLYQFMTGVQSGRPPPPHAKAFHASVRFREP